METSTEVIIADPPMDATDAMQQDLILRILEEGVNANRMSALMALVQEKILNENAQLALRIKALEDGHVQNAQTITAHIEATEERLKQEAQLAQEKLKQEQSKAGRANILLEQIKKTREEADAIETRLRERLKAKSEPKQ